MGEQEALYQIDSDNGETKWRKALIFPTNLSFIGNNVYVLELFSRIIHTLNIENGNELGSLQIAPQRILGTETQEMVSTGTSLVFSRGCEVFVYGD
jgi:outer membrane protein assembly factor BamB